MQHEAVRGLIPWTCMKLVALCPNIKWNESWYCFIVNFTTLQKWTGEKVDYLLVLCCCPTCLQAPIQRQNRRPRLDPSKLVLEDLTGDENVAVVNRNTGKRITGVKAPALRHLGPWLVRNPGFDIDPKWAHIVRQMVSGKFQLCAAEGLGIVSCCDVILNVKHSVTCCCDISSAEAVCSNWKASTLHCTFNCTTWICMIVWILNCRQVVSSFVVCIRMLLSYSQGIMIYFGSHISKV